VPGSSAGQGRPVAAAEVARRLEMSRGGVIYRAQKYGLMSKPDR
jgi:hypothetical protein